MLYESYLMTNIFGWCTSRVTLKHLYVLSPKSSEEYYKKPWRPLTPPNFSLLMPNSRVKSYRWFSEWIHPKDLHVSLIVYTNTNISSHHAYSVSLELQKKKKKKNTLGPQSCLRVNDTIYINLIKDMSIIYNSCNFKDIQD